MKVVLICCFKDHFNYLKVEFNDFFFGKIVPGEPSLFGVLNVDRANVYLGWNRPEINRWCVQR